MRLKFSNPIPTARQLERQGAQVDSHWLGASVWHYTPLHRESEGRVLLARELHGRVWLGVRWATGHYTVHAASEVVPPSWATRCLTALTAIDEYRTALLQQAKRTGFVYETLPTGYTIALSSHRAGHDQKQASLWSCSVYAPDLVGEPLVWSEYTARPEEALNYVLPPLPVGAGG